MIERSYKLYCQARTRPLQFPAPYVNKIRGRRASPLGGPLREDTKAMTSNFTTLATLRRAARSTVLGTLTAVALATILTAAPAKAETFKITVAAGHPPVFLWVKLMHEQFIPEVDKRLAAAGNHSIEWTEAYGGTVAKIGGVLEAIGDGLVDMGFVGTIFEAPKMPLQNVSYMTPFGTADIAAVSGTVARLQRDIPAMGASWTKQNQVYLGGAALDTYHLYTTFPVTSMDDLKGRKISAPGPSANWIKNTGAVAVAGNLQTYYNDIKTGVSEGTLTFAGGAWGSKVFEVAPYITKVNFGAQFAGGISINKDVWESFPQEVRDVFQAVADDYSANFAATQQAVAKALIDKMAAAGATVSELDAKERARWAKTVPNVAKGWAAGLDAKGLPGSEVLKGYMKALIASGADIPRDWSQE